jgi:hypothetical protein
MPLAAIAVLGAFATDTDPRRTEDIWAEARQREEKRRQGASDEEVRTVAASARICGLGDWRREIISEIEQEHRYAQRVGVTNLALLQELKETLQAIETAKLGQELTWMDRQLVACSEPRVAALASCVGWAVRSRSGMIRVRQPPKPEPCGIAALQPYVSSLTAAR